MTNNRQQAPSGQLGLARYRRYTDAFDHIDNCIANGYNLEAIAVLDSLIGDRLASRIGFLQGKEVSSRPAIGRLCRILIDATPPSRSGLETDHEFRVVVQAILAWTEDRNEAMHGTAKVLRDNAVQVSFHQLIEGSRHIAIEGRRLLREFDKIDTVSRRLAGKIPATYPNAFFPDERDPIAERR